MRIKKTLSLDTDFVDKSEKLRLLLHYPDVSSLIEQLIREEWERRNGALTLVQQRGQAAAAEPPKSRAG